jgi:uncharacterized membrane protein
MAARQMIKQHFRLLSSVAAAVLLYFLLPHEWRQITRVLIAWNAGVLLFLILIAQLIFSMDATQISKRYEPEDEAAPVILIISIIGAILAMASIVAYLSTMDVVPQSHRAIHMALAGLTVIDTWVLIPTLFTMHYADMFYSVGADQRPLHFPDTDETVFWDFAYFSFTISAACQTADVSTAQGTIRKIVIAHSVLSFFFNASVLGFAINVMAGLIGK